MGAQILEKLLTDSPILALVAIGIYYFFKYMRDQHLSHLKSKDKEIERLVKERDRLQGLILEQRLTTEPPVTPPAKKPGKK
jgi:hypothetical protein